VRARSILAPVHFAELTAPEQRVLGCLIEKRWTTPDQYPLSLNALRLACNQSTNRDPVTAYDEVTVSEAGQRLQRYGLARLASGHGSRATKYRHLAEEGLGLGREQLAILCVLLLRGPQTPGELKGRSERMAPLATLEEVERVLSELGERGYVRRLPRRPGQKEDRFEQILGGDGGEDVRSGEGARSGEGSRPGEDVRSIPAGSDRALAPSPTVSDHAGPSSPADEGLEDRVAELEALMADVRNEVIELRAEVSQLRAQVGSASPTR
jgi:uncharacterized protein